MNKYSLKFKDAGLEQLYTANRVQSMAYPIFLLMTAQITIYMIIVVIERLVTQEYTLVLYLTVGTIGYVLVSFIIVRRKKHWAEYSLCVLNHIFMSFQLQFDGDEEIYTIFLFGSNLMIAHCVILFVSDFQLALISTISMTTIRLAITVLHSDISFKSYVLTAMGFIMLVLSLYWKNYNSRLQYLLTLKDSQWECLLPQIVDNNYFIFTLNEQQLRFELKLSNCQSTESRDLVEFLRNSIFEGKSLEAYIFNRFRSGRALSGISTKNSYKMNIHYQKKTIQIKYIEYFLTEPTFVIVMETQEVQIAKTHYESINKQQIASFSHFIKQISNKLQHCLQKQNYHKLHEVQLALYEFQARLLLTQGSVHPSPIRVRQVICKCSKLFPQIRLQLTMSRNLVFITMKPLFILWLISLLKHSAKGYIRILTTQEKANEISFLGKINKFSLGRDELFQYATEQLTVSGIDRPDGYQFTFLTPIEPSFTMRVNQY